MTKAAKGTAPTKVGIYTRISSDKRGKREGVANQRQDCEALAKRLGYEVHDVYEDDDRGASRHSSTKPRPRFEDLKRDLGDGTIDGVVFYSQSRLTRQPLEFHQFIQDYYPEENGRVLVAVDKGAYDLTTADGRFQASNQASHDAKESDVISDRTRRNFEGRAKRGKVKRTGQRPYGFKKDFITHEPAEAAVIREAANRVLSGESLYLIARQFEQRGVKSHVLRIVQDDKGNTLLDDDEKPIREEVQRIMTYQTWRNLLMSPRVAGFLVYRGEIVPNVTPWKPIIEPEQWEAVCAILSNRAKSRGVTPRSNRHLLSGLVFCDTCKGFMYPDKRNPGKQVKTTSGPVFYYRCKKAPGKTNCGKMSIAAAPVEDLVKLFAFEAIVASKVPKTKKGKEQSASLTLQINGAKARLEKLEDDHYSEGLMSDKRFLELHRKLTAQITDLEDKLANLTATTTLTGVPKTVEGLEKAWSSASLSWKQELLKATISQVLIRPAEKRGRYQDYRARVDVIRSGSAVAIA